MVGRVIEGSAGTVVFGNGVTALEGEVVEVYDDCFTFRVERVAASPGSTMVGAVIVVPFTSMAYYRFEGESHD